MCHYSLDRETESPTHGEKDTNSRKNYICRGESLGLGSTLAAEYGTVPVWTYETGTSAEDNVGRDIVQPIDNRSEPLDQHWITIPEFIKGLGLRLEYSKN